MHPADRIAGTTGQQLSGKRVLLCVTGSIAAVESIRLARLLRRHGAEVIPLMSEAATHIISPEALHFATGVETVTALTGAVEHISLLREEDCTVLVAPATANIVSKIACGLADDAVSTLCLNALGMKVPIIIAPAMGESMIRNPFLAANTQKLARQGVQILPSIVEEREAKLLSPDFVLEAVIRTLSRGLLRRRHMLVIGGASEEAVDDVRFISSHSSGQTAVEIATVAYEQQATVEMWCGRMEIIPPPFLTVSNFRGVRELSSMIKKRKYDIVAVPASLSDFLPRKKEGKIPSSAPPVIETSRAPKIVEQLRPRSKVLIGFKAEVTDDKTLVERAEKRMREVEMDMVVANNPLHVSRERTSAFIVTAAGKEKYEGTKRGLADRIIELAAGLK
ncbi:MAG: bifunctional phosphopantothenoylcysteine decarboxylase/phosphopantothenate--cysteine ligase CoaBC [Methanomassiliicoccales archaeon]